MCSAADDPTTYDERWGDHFVPANAEVRFILAIAVRNMTWVRMQNEADALMKLHDAGENVGPIFGSYNDAQKDYEQAVTTLAREKAHWKANGGRERSLRPAPRA